MYAALLGLHIVVCVVLIFVVLLQSGKAADLAGAFGGGGSQTALGSRGAATVLTKATTASAILFMLTSLGLALMGSRRSGSVLESVPASTAPLKPAAAAGAPATASPEPTEPAAAVPSEPTAGESAAPSAPPKEGAAAPAAQEKARAGAKAPSKRK